MTSMIKGLLPLGLWYIIHSQNTSPAEHDVCFFPLEMYIQYKQEARGKTMLGNRFLWGLLSLVSFALRSLNYCNITLKLLLFFPERLLPLHEKSAQTISFKVIIHHLMPVITSWMPNQINSSSAMSLCNCLTQLTCRR